ncbi:FecR family protein [Chitinophaga arvensicola]|uniref:Ferric-dicitrate binding protein FerR, regulates iron transport through sigma-19 n=1 Tax=Chitinophaga arvensicola TaxID=29529 RepID=A0A1I0R483_9BACT|nr:FecR family protein [Chitinophaga arvensicola]SEW35331.1 ferric-dicitrate binding protein FerR, regulates iron transport through sigma-19 [Chitinophaga arvensicola]
MHQQSSQQELYTLIKKYRKGLCTPQEVDLLFRWLDKMGNDLSAEEAATLHIIRNTMKREVWEQQQKLITPPAANGIIRKLATHRGWQVAAAATGLIILAYLLFRSSAHQMPMATNEGPAQPVAAIKDSLITNLSKDKQRYQLADGSVITVSPHTSIHLKMPWPQQGREIRLNGEALFEVAKDAHHPFTVNTKRFSTAVLGTVFRITAYDSSAFSRVQLLSGSIAVNSKQQSIVMLPGNDFSFDSHMQQLKPEKTVIAATAPAATAAEGSVVLEDSIFHFNNTPLVTVLHTLSAQYQTSIQYAPTLKLSKRKYTGNIKITKSLDEILGMLTSLNDLRVDSTAAGYLIRSN